MATHVIGTAGHVDHGKSSLVTALTGINPDRLKEECAREMTIELGFAWFTLPSGEEVGIVDVPGHRDFIENMLAGVGGIDAVLFVIAADEGVMPQTREHLAILDLLKISNGIIVLTKCDLIKDEEWLILIEEDIRAAVRNTFLADSPFVRVSSKTNEGIPGLFTEIAAVLENCPEKLDNHQPRLPIDRVFSMPGFGTILTGTLLDGSLKLGEEVTILPKGIKTRIRGIQNHKTKVDIAHPGQRTAINLTGVAVEDVRRGDVLTLPGLYSPTRRIDVTFELLRDVNSSIKHRDEIKLFIDATEVHGSIRLLGMDELSSGKSAFLQIELAEPIVAKKGDRFILRRPSPGETLGGGSIIEVNSLKRYKRFSTEVLNLLEKKFSGSDSEKLLTLIHSESPVLVSGIIAKSNLERAIVMEIVHSLENENQVRLIKVSDNINQCYLISQSYNQSTIAKVILALTDFHNTNPLKHGIAREELRSKLKLAPKIFNKLIENWITEGAISADQNFISMHLFSINLTNDQVQKIDNLMGKFNQNTSNPPSTKEAISEVGDDLYRLLIENGDLIQLSEDVVYTIHQYEKIKEEVINYLNENGSISVAIFRDKFLTSRKYALAFLEYLDQRKITRREGDFRKLIKR
jgi:selenocysteine-specific elongation factor